MTEEFKNGLPRVFLRGYHSNDFRGGYRGQGHRRNSGLV
jgi:hypothetical protein